MRDRLRLPILMVLAGLPLGPGTRAPSASTARTSPAATARGPSDPVSPRARANAPPTANPGGPYSNKEGKSIRFDGRGSSDPDGSALTYAWDFGDGSTDTGPRPSHTYVDDGEYTVTLTVTDATNETSAPATTTASISNVAPTVVLAVDPTTLATGATLSLSGSFTDPGTADGPWAYEINWGDGSTKPTGTVSDQVPAITDSHVYAVGGTFTVRLKVTDKDGASRSATSEVTVTAGPPVANAGGPYTGTEGSAVSFDGSGSSGSAGGALTYAWDFGDGTTGSGAKPTHAYADEGTFTVSLTVTDSKGASSEPATSSATIANAPPAVSLTGPSSIILGQPLNVTGSVSDPGAGDAPWTYSLAWGDGAHDDGSLATLSPITASHTFAVGGTYAVTLTVTGADGGIGADTLAVTVGASAGPVVLLLAGDITDCKKTNDELTANMIDAIPDATVFTLGDNVYPEGTLELFEQCYGPTWGRHKARTWPSAGDHDYRSGLTHGEGYHAYFGSRAGTPGDGWYSVDIGDWHIVVLNSNAEFVGVKNGTPQELWLKNDLANNTKLCTLAVWHHPRFFSGKTNNKSAKTLPFWRDLYAANAELIINGHQHFYERFAPQNPDGDPDPQRGIRQIIAGAGGESQTAFGPAAPNSLVRNSGAFGILKLTLGVASYSWEFLPVPGKSFTDSGSGTCH